MTNFQSNTARPKISTRRNGATSHRMLKAIISMKWAIRFMSLHPGSKSHAIHPRTPYRTRRLPVMAHGGGSRWWRAAAGSARTFALVPPPRYFGGRSEEHTSELQSHLNLVCRLLLAKKKQKLQFSITTL